MEKLHQNIESLFTDMNKLVTKLDINPRIMELMNYTSDLNDQQVYNLFRVQEELKIYDIPETNSYSSLYIYFKKINKIVGPDTINDPKAFFQKHCRNSELSYEDWLKLIGSSNKGSFIPLPDMKNSSSKNIGTVLFVRSLPISKNNDIDANVIITLDNAAFIYHSIGVKELKDQSIFVVDEQNKVLFSTDYSLSNNIVGYNTLIGKSEVFNVKKNNGKFVATYTMSDVSKWKCVSLVSTNVYWEKSLDVRNVIVGAIVLCMIIGSIITSYFVKRHYKPIKMLMDSVESKSKLQFNNQSNEFDYLESALNSTFDNYDKVTYKLERQNHVLKSGFICRLIKGREGRLFLQEKLSEYNISFFSNYFAVISIYIENCDEFIQRQWKETESDSLDLLHFIITNVVEELLAEKNQGFMVEIDEMLVCLVNFKAPKSPCELLRTILLRSNTFCTVPFP